MLRRVILRVAGRSIVALRLIIRSAVAIGAGIAAAVRGGVVIAPASVGVRAVGRAGGNDLALSHTVRREKLTAARQKKVNHGKWF